MAGRNALATPTNVYPRNGNVVTFSPKTKEPGNDQFVFSFTNQCDTLSYYGITIYDATTNKLVRNWIRKTYQNNDPSDIYVYHRGDVIRSHIDRKAFNDSKQTLLSGYHYNYKITLYSCVPDPTGSYQNIPNCVVPYASGKILKVGETDVTTSSDIKDDFNKLTIQNGIKNLKPPRYWENTKELVGCTYLRIGHQERMVLDYDSKTGVVKVASDFNINDNDMDFSDKNGVQYFLYCNYIETGGSESEGSYDFYIRENIKTSFSGSPVPVGLQCRTTYSHPNNVGLENYRFKVYNLGGDNYINGEIADITSDIEDRVDNHNLPVGTGLSGEIVGKYIRIAKTVNESFENNIVTEGSYGKIIGYDESTGIATLQIMLDNIPESGTRYSIIMDKRDLLMDSGDVFSYHMCYNFPIYPYGQTFEVETILTTYEKQTASNTKVLYVPEPTKASLITDHEVIVDEMSQRLQIQLHGGYPSTSRYWRNIYRRISGDTVWNWLGYLRNSNYYIDYLAGNNRTYEYLVSEEYDPTTSDYTKYEPDKNYKSYKITDVTTKWDGWTITALYPYNKIKRYSGSLVELKTSANSFIQTFPYLKKPYVIGDTWRFISDIDSGSITNNLGRTLHVGTSKLPTVTGTNNNYQSGSFTANLLQLECPSGEILDDIEKVDAWLKFINDDCLFLLKSEKGDVWVVAISENTSRTYDESTNWVLTKVSYSWVEVEKTDDIQIVQQ